MPYDLSEPSLWFVPGSLSVYRVLDAEATYAPDAPFPSSEGRYSNGIRKVLYVAQTPEVAVSEYLRHHPEFLGLQPYLRLRISEITLDVPAVEALDVRTEEQAAKIPFPYHRLVSSERDAVTRNSDCQELADSCDGSSGITGPSAALAVLGPWTFALFGERGDRWISNGCADVPRPTIDPASVRLLDS